MRSNCELLDTLCEKRHDTAVVMDNKYFITLVSVHIAIIFHLWACFFYLPLAHENASHVIITHDIGR